MNNNPDCHPEKPENGQQNAAIFDSEARHYLITAAETAEVLARMAWNAYFAAKYNDSRRALYNLNEARIYSKSVQKRLDLLPPTEEYTGNVQTINPHPGRTCGNCTNFVPYCHRPDIGKCMNGIVHWTTHDRLAFDCPRYETDATANHETPTPPPPANSR